MKKFTLSILTAISIITIVGCQEKTASTTKPIVPTSENFVPLNRKINKVHSQTVYVPIYSSIQQHLNRLTNLSAILSIRNVSLNHEIIISQVDYFDTNGKFLKSYIAEPFSLKKMSSKDFLIPVMDVAGGSGANFIVKWETETQVVAPIIESIMIGSLGTHGFSFSSQGKEVDSSNYE